MDIDTFENDTILDSVEYTLIKDGIRNVLSMKRNIFSNPNLKCSNDKKDRKKYRMHMMRKQVNQRTLKCSSYLTSLHNMIYAPNAHSNER